MKKRALLLVNVGTPDKPETKEVRKYLFQFLNDPNVIDIPWLFRKILVNGIIIPFRVKKSTSLYKKLWTKEGSPLLIYLNSLCTKVQELLDNNYIVFPAMRYGNPSLRKTLQQIKQEGFDEITILPLFPQYATSTTLSAYKEILHEINTWKIIPGIRLIEQFYDHPAFIKAFASRINKHNLSDFDHVIFTYHGLPLRQVQKIHPQESLESCNCEKEMPKHGKSCYKATCYETTRLLAQEIKLDKNKYSIGFQSRLSNNWLSPFTDDLLVQLAQKGAKKILIISPSFVADCLETTIEIEDEYKEIFKEAGGEQLILAKSLNDSNEWAEGIVKIILKK